MIQWNENRSGSGKQRLLSTVVRLDVKGVESSVTILEREGGVSLLISRRGKIDPELWGTTVQDAKDFVETMKSNAEAEKNRLHDRLEELKDEIHDIQTDLGWLDSEVINFLEL